MLHCAAQTAIDFLMKFLRLTVNVPLSLAPMIMARIPECPYSGASAYFLALAIFDCWSRREHKLTTKLMALPGKAKDEAFVKIAEEFARQTEARAAGKTTPEEQKLGWFDHFIKRIVEEEIHKATSGLPKPQPSDAKKKGRPADKAAPKRKRKKK